MRSSRQSKKMEKTTLEFVARMTMPDGQVIERRVEADGGLLSPDDFDTSSKEGFLKSFDALEQSTLKARNRIAEDIAEAYLEEVSKKNGW